MGNDPIGSHINLPIINNLYLTLKRILSTLGHYITILSIDNMISTICFCVAQRDPNKSIFSINVI